MSTTVSTRARGADRHGRPPGPARRGGEPSTLRGDAEADRADRKRHDAGASGFPGSGGPVARQQRHDVGCQQPRRRGVTNTITNAANNQLVQQVITANINITGLSQMIQQSVASTVLSRVAAANAQFR